MVEIKKEAGGQENFRIDKKQESRGKNLSSRVGCAVGTWCLSGQIIFEVVFVVSKKGWSVNSSNLGFWASFYMVYII